MGNNKKMTQETQNIQALDFSQENSLKNVDVLTCDTDKPEDNQSDLYFKISRSEDYDFKFGSDKSISVNEITKLIKRNFKPWKTVKVGGATLKDVSGHGGSRTYLIETKDKSVSKEFRKLIFHKRNLDETDPLTEERMIDAQKAMWESGVAAPRLVSGKNWYFEQFISGLVGWNNVDKVNRLDYAVLMAKLHKNTATEWFEKHRQRAIEMFPILKDTPLGSHAWLFVTRMSWFKRFEHSHEFFTQAGFEPLSEAGKRITVVHGDIHPANAILRKDSKSCLIDFEFTAPYYAINDLAYTFADWNQCTGADTKSKHEFCKKYLEELGLLSDDEQVELLVFDAECARLRAFHFSTLNREMEKKSRHREHDLDMYKAYEKFESIARADKELIKKIAQEGFYRVADETESVKEVIAKIAAEDEKRHQAEKGNKKGGKKSKKRSEEENQIYRIKTNVANSVINFANSLRNNKKKLPEGEESKKTKAWRN